MKKFLNWKFFLITILVIVASVGYGWYWIKYGDVDRGLSSFARYAEQMNYSVDGVSVQPEDTSSQFDDDTVIVTANIKLSDGTILPGQVFGCNGSIFNWVTNRGSCSPTTNIRSGGTGGARTDNQVNVKPAKP